MAFINGQEVLFSPSVTVVEGSGGTSEYADLNNKPQINGVELSGNKSTEELNLKQIYVQSEEPTDAPEGAVWIDPEEDSGDVVTSVNGQTGEVKLTAQDVGALPEGTEIPESYTLPIATADTLGGVKPVAKTEDMTQEVGVDETGALFTAPGSDGGTEKEWRLIRTVEITEAVSSISISTDEEGNAFELDEFLIYAPLNVTASQNSQFVVSANGKEFTSGNNALGTTAKSVLVYSEWKGVRLHTVGTTTYDYASVAGNVAARRIVMGDACRTVTELKLSGQSGATINSGTFYIYGR